VPDDDQQLAEVEAWFLQRGIPHFIANYDVSTRVWTRALPFLVSVYVLGVIPYGADTWGEAAVQFATGVFVLGGAWILSNLLRGNALFVVPNAVGPFELAVFVLGPAVHGLVLGEWLASFTVMVIYAVILGLTYLVVSYGLIPLLLWGVRRFFSVLAIAGTASVRALPVLLLVVTFFFITAEVWQVFAGLEGLPYGLTLMLFVLTGAAFVASSASRDIRESEDFGTWDDVVGAAEGTPAAGLAPGKGTVDEPRIGVRQRINLVLVAITSQTLLAVTIAFIVGVFFGIFGFLAIGPDVIEAWTLQPPNVLFTLDVADQQLVLTEDLIRVAGFLATFTGFYYAVYSIGDPSLREGLSDETEEGLHQLFAGRLLYLRARRNFTPAKTSAVDVDES
jgi:hypothetical protein